MVTLALQIGMYFFLEMVGKILLLFWIGVFGTMKGLTAENNDRTKEVFEVKLKNEFGCSPPEEWDLIREGQKDIFIPHICLPKTYNAYKAPKKNHLTDVAILFSNTKILDVDERKKSLTASIRMYTYWEDPRIKLNVPNNTHFIELPSITKTERTIWYPFRNLLVKDIMELMPLDDPIICLLYTSPSPRDS